MAIPVWRYLDDKGEHTALYKMIKSTSTKDLYRKKLSL